MEGQIGEIAVGAHADFLIVDVDPLAGLDCFAQADNKVVGVVQGGTPVRDDIAAFGPI